ncbi:hypothetical protein ACFP2F_22660 [Hymenobacter artigasi]|uniref:Uncharacterized protein n=1 Tax=Hymenobacter artigasi TaxID=2719616 RepID=A0ABX1HNH0_9BACT|nr:hypothetical protein [Hymenobacter artigasi]NKI91813.1 hypothetical protein [Hymenobacter artigasi]
METVERLAPALLHILQAELAVGNEIQEVSTWPPKCELFVLLKRKFCASYLPLYNVEFRFIDDYHYWFAEYDYKNGLQRLACGFNESL